MKAFTSIALAVVFTAVAALFGSGLGGIVPPPAEAAGQTLRFYLHSNHLRGTGDGYVMNETSPEPHILTIDLLASPHWFSDPPLKGRFEPEASFMLVKPCTLGLTVAPVYTLALADASGNEIRRLGQSTPSSSLCIDQERIIIPTEGPFSLDDGRLKLTIGPVAGLTVDLALGSGSYLEATGFVPDIAIPQAALGVSPGSIDDQPADEPPGPLVIVGDTIEVLVVVYNDGDVDLANLHGTSMFGVVNCQDDALPYGEPTYCWATGQADGGQQEITITFQAEGPGGGTVQAESVTYYRGVAPPIEP